MERLVFECDVGNANMDREVKAKGKGRVKEMYI